MKTILKSLIVPAALMTMLASCGGEKQVCELTKSGLNPADFDTTYTDTIRGEKAVKLYTLTNKNGMEVCLTNIGARIVSIVVPDKDGNWHDVVLSYPTAPDFFLENNLSDFGASIGRYANRIKNGQYTLDGQTIDLHKNNFGHCLHGGLRGWQYQVYDAEQNGNTVTFTLVAPDGENQFTGTITAVVSMTLTEDNAINIDYTATTDQPTIINMTNHSYFNLNGDPSTTINNHIAQINADSYTPTDATYMTTGEILPVEGTCFDFRTPKRIGLNYDGEEQEPAAPLMVDAPHSGYDHNWCLNTYADGKGDDTQVCATVWSPTTGIQLDVFTNEPGIQFYTGNFQDGTVVGKKGIVYPKNAAFCLESQKYPDTPNKADWPSCVLRPAETYHSTCTFKFSIHE
ncbi:MAG: galactose mutarotase [Bacteroidaceae bacterium]|nr:galactose mutarotase [Bacteroidaceae bacterium]